MKLGDLDDAALLALAGAASLKRGLAYFRDGRIEISFSDERGLKGVAYGQTRYPLSLGLAGRQWKWQCACPAADDGSFCKHLVAAVLTARENDAPGGATKASAGTSRRGALGTFLKAQPAERLADWLLALADEDPAIGERLELHRAAKDPAQLKDTVKRLLGVRRFLDYHETRSFARKLDPLLEQLNALLEHDPAALRDIAEIALKRLFAIFGNSDDSAGALGEQAEALAELYAQACKIAAPGKSLAKSFWGLKKLDEWRLLPLAAFWPALGEDGQRDYARQVLQALDRLPAPKPEAYGLRADSAVIDLAEELATVSDDFELLERILRRDLHRAYDHFRLIAAMRDFARHREALAEAELAVKRFPDDTRLREALADCLQQAGLDGEALAQRWEAFVLAPNTSHWDGLKAASGQDWPGLKQRALAHLAVCERDDISLRTALLIHDDDIEAAATLAETGRLHVDLLAQLADRLRIVDAGRAGRMYLRVLEHTLSTLQPTGYPLVVRLLKRIKACLPAEASKAAVARVRLEHVRKTKLIGLIDAAGL